MDASDYTVDFLIAAISAGEPLVEGCLAPAVGNGYAASFVYFIGCRDRVKVGFSVNPHMRANEATAWCPYQLTIIGVLPGGPEEEKALHQALWRRHAHCEWFHMNDQLEEILCKHTLRYALDGSVIKQTRPRTAPRPDGALMRMPLPDRRKKWNLYKGQLRDQ